MDDGPTDCTMTFHDGAQEEASNTEPLMPSDANEHARNSQVVRKVNSGFQILRPGTLDAPPQRIHNEDGKKAGIGNKQHSRKLQKKGRANTYFVEEP